MYKVLEPINFADLDLVFLKDGTPHCTKHGAMNKMNVLEDGGGYWRCLSEVSQLNDNVCRAGCCEKRLSGEYTMDGKPDKWKIVYYPILEDGKTGEIYAEARVLVERPIEGGIDFREVPLRYLTKA